METNFDLNKYNKNEFRIVTIVIIFLILKLISVAASGGGSFGFGFNYQYLYDERHLSFSFFENYLLPWSLRYIALYLAYVLAHFIIIKNVLNGVALNNTIVLSAAAFVGLVITWTWTDVWIRHYLFYGLPVKMRSEMNQEETARMLGQNFITICWATCLYAVYTYAKYSKQILFTLETVRTRGSIWQDCYWAGAVWIVLFIAIQGPAILALPTIALYAYLSVRLIPLVKSQGKGITNLLSRVTLIALCLSMVFIFFFAITVHHNIDSLALAALAYSAFHVFIVSPITWGIYHYRLSRTQEITGLKTALGQSSANLDFLRSQINPHFLFNALNTLYGTAIQENADRTSEGIQKLGDMMRFMLHENTQEKTSLMREVDYLKNYIDLQRLRTHTSPDIVIQTEIEESINGLQIAPMLLIPFVENAFKHGISLREASYIKITLHTEANNLFFDVQNSVHPKTGTDPEKNNTGIGLENVKQRLQLLYPEQHELMTRQTGKEYFAHLTVELK